MIKYVEERNNQNVLVHPNQNWNVHVQNQHRFMMERGDFCEFARICDVN